MPTCDDAKPTDETGTATFVLPQSALHGVEFRYFEVSGSDLLPALHFFMHPLLGARATRPVFVSTLSGAAAVRDAVGKGPPRTDVGTVLAWLADCVGSTDTVDPESTGVTFAIDGLADARPIYARGGSQPDPNLRAGQLAYFFDVPEGRWRVFAFNGKGPAASASVAVRGGHMTWVYLNLPHFTQ